MRPQFILDVVGLLLDIGKILLLEGLGKRYAKILEEGIALRASDIDLVWLNGYAFPRWRGSLFLGALSGEMLVRLELDREKVVHEERLLEDLETRIRDVRQGPDGRLYLLTDEADGALLRLDPLP